VITLLLLAASMGLVMLVLSSQRWEELFTEDSSEDDFSQISVQFLSLDTNLGRIISGEG